MNYTYKVTDKQFMKAKLLIMDNGDLYVEGETHYFVVSGVKGSFYKDGDEIFITIRSKPLLASWSMIEEKLDEFFN